MNIAVKWVESLRLHPYREHLFPMHDIVIQIEYSNQKQFFSISQSKIEILSNYDQEADCIVIGDVQVFDQIFSGELKLLDAIELNKVSFEGSYRTLLKLESVFWLNQSKAVNE